MITIFPHESSRSSCACMMIVRDSEGTILRCLDSILFSNCFDQIIVIMDTRTKDRTPEIISSLQSRRAEVTYSWYNWEKDDFSKARNEALKYCKTKYGFWMDSDDEILDLNAVKTLLKDPRGAAYHFKIIIPGPNWQSTSVINHLRLFPVIEGVRWELPIHEQLAFSIRKLGIPEIQTQYRIFHWGYLKTSDVKAKHKRNYNVMKKWLSENKEDTPQRQYILERWKESSGYLSPEV